MRGFPESQILRDCVVGQEDRGGFRKEADHGVVSDRVDGSGATDRSK